MNQVNVPIFKTIQIDEGEEIPFGVDIEGRTISGWISTPEVDRDGEIVLPGAFDAHLDVYRSNPVLLTFHKHKDLPVGKAIELEASDKGLWGKFKIAKTSLGNEVLQLVAEGCLRGFSAGFVPIDVTENPSLFSLPKNSLRTSMGKKVRKSYSTVELVEVSLLGIPSNRSALIEQSAKGNKVANLVLKSFDYEGKDDDFELVIKQWMEDNENSLVEDNEVCLMYYLDTFMADELVKEQDKLPLKEKLDKEKLHCTVKYFGKMSEENAVILYRALYNIIQNERNWVSEDILIPLGYDVFGDDNDTIVARYNSSRLNSFKDTIERRLARYGFNYEDTFPEYLPHISLGKIEDGKSGIDLDGKIPSSIRLTALELRQGGKLIGPFIFNIEHERPLGRLISKIESPIKLTYTLKSLLWDENKHPRDDSGRFADKPDTFDKYRDDWEGNARYDSTTGLLIRQSDQIKRYEDRLNELVKQQKISNDQLKQINDKDSWGSWFKKWLFRAAIATVGYFAFKKFKKSPQYPEMKKKARQWLADYVLNEKSFDSSPEMVEFNTILDTLSKVKTFLDKGIELGLQDTPEYLRAERIWNSGVSGIKKMVQEDGSKVIGLKGLLERNIVTKEMSADKFKEEEHPRHADGKFRNKYESGNNKVESSTPDEKILTHGKSKSEFLSDFHKYKDTFKNWIGENKGKIILSASLSPIVPLAFMVAKVNGRLAKFAYSGKSNKIVPFNNLSWGEKKAFFNQMEPGDVFMQGGKPYKGITSAVEDAVKGKDPQGNMDLFLKAITNGEYPHTALVVGHYDDIFHKRIMNALKSDPNSSEFEAAKIFLINSVGSDPYKEISLLLKGKKINNPKYFRSLQEVDSRIREWESGLPLIVMTYDNPKAEKVGKILIRTTEGPYGGEEAIGAILRTKVSYDKRYEMSEKIKDAFFTGYKTNPPIKMAIGPNRKPYKLSNLEIGANILGDPLTKTIARTVVKDDHMLCSGVVAELYKQFGGININTGKEFRYVTPTDLIKNKKFASIILEARKKENYDNLDWEKEPLKIMNGELLGRKEVNDNIVAKEMSKEQFKEEEHPRSSDGKFKDKYAGDSRSEEIASGHTLFTHDQLKNIGLAAGGIGLTYLGYRVGKSSNVWKTFGGNAEKIKGWVDDISKSRPGIITNRNKTIENILNIKIEDSVNKSKLTPDQKKIYDYVSNPSNFQKDLIESFGHIENKPGSRKVFINNVKDVPDIKIKDDKSFKDYYFASRNTLTCYDPIVGDITINVNQLDYIMKHPEIGIKDFKTALIHEYAHSIFLENKSYWSAYKGDFDREVKKLIGTKFTDSTGIGDIKFKIKDTKIVEGKMFDKLITDPLDIGFINENRPPRKVNNIDFLKRIGLIDEKRASFLREIKEYKTNLKLEPDDEKTKAIVRKYINPEGTLDTTTLEEILKNNPRLDIGGIDSRKLYSLMNLHEFFAVRAEQGLRM